MHLKERKNRSTYNLTERLYSLITKVRSWVVSYFLYLVLILPSSCSLDSDTIAKQIDHQHYFTYYISGLFATTSTYLYVNVYENKDWWLDREIADIVMPVSGSLHDTIEVSYQRERLKVVIQGEIKVDTLILEGQSVKLLL